MRSSPSAATAPALRRRPLAGRVLGAGGRRRAPLADAVRAVRARGTFMQEAVPGGRGRDGRGAGPGARQGEGAPATRRPRARWSSPANYNSPEQTVIAGHADGGGARRGEAQGAGAKRVLPLPVSAPFHCALMEPVKPRLAEVLARCSVSRAAACRWSPTSRPRPTRTPRAWCRCCSSRSARRCAGSSAWRRSSAAGVTRIVELGPGKVLGGLVKRITKDIEIAQRRRPGEPGEDARGAGGSMNMRLQGQGRAGHRRLARHRAGVRGRRSARRARTVVINYAGNEAAAQRDRRAGRRRRAARPRRVKFDVADTAACAAAIDEHREGARPAGRAGEQRRRRRSTACHAREGRGLGQAARHEPQGRLRPHPRRQPAR